jgi:hypothetical protein
MSSDEYVSTLGNHFAYLGDGRAFARHPGYLSVEPEHLEDADPPEEASPSALGATEWGRDRLGHALGEGLQPRAFSAVISRTLRHFSQRRLRSFWATTPSTESAMDPRTPSRSRRRIAVVLLAECIDETVRCPELEKSKDALAENRSRISPIRRMPGSWRTAERRSDSKDTRAFSSTCCWLAKGIRYSTGSSTVITLMNQVLDLAKIDRRAHGRAVSARGTAQWLRARSSGRRPRGT